MDVKKLKEKLRKYEKIKNEALDIRAKIITEAEKDYRNTAKDGEACKRVLLKEFKNSAWEYVKDDAPYTRSGDREYFDSIRLIDDGVSIRWNADHPNDIIDVEITFEELCSL